MYTSKTSTCIRMLCWWFNRTLALYIKLSCLCLNHADSLISQCGDTAAWVDITKFLTLLQSYERPCPADTSARNNSQLTIIKCICIRPYSPCGESVTRMTQNWELPCLARRWSETGRLALALSYRKSDIHAIV